jgi:hypothetical protein
MRYPKDCQENKPVIKTELYRRVRPSNECNS